jgi:hypothetical protein
MSSICPYYQMFILSMLLSSVIEASDTFGGSRKSSPDMPDASDAFGVSRRCSPDMPNLEFNISL